MKMRKLVDERKLFKVRIFIRVNNEIFDFLYMFY